MRVIPVAGQDSMLLNLSGAHGPFFTRNVVLLTDSAGHTGAGEVPGGEKIRRVLEEAKALVVGRPLAAYNAVLNAVRTRFAEFDREGRGVQTFDLRTTSARGDGDRGGAAGSAGPVCADAGRGAAGRRAAAGERRCAWISVLCWRSTEDGSAVSQRCRMRTMQWLRLRHEEALTTEAVVRLAEAAHARYGFRDFKLKGGVLAGAREMEAVAALAERFPEARITLDPNGAWPLDEAVRLCEGKQRCAGLRGGSVRGGEGIFGARDHGGVSPGDRAADGDEHGRDRLARVEACGAVERASIFRWPIRTSGRCRGRCAWRSFAGSGG